MELLESLSLARKAYEQKVRPFLDSGDMDMARMEMIDVALYVQLKGEEIKEYHSGLTTLATARMVMSPEVKFSRRICDRFYVGLRQLELAVQSGNT